MTQEPEIVCERRGPAGLITLNRPRALNAITLGMVRAIREALDAWADDPMITRVVIVGGGERAFSAGGDLRHLYDLGRAQRYEEALTFWREEYALNLRIKRYAKPYVAIIDGLVMGGGVGVSLHGSHRVAGERYQFAMPEVGIGFFPDVGATYALPRLPGRTGTYLALTGERVRAPEALALGLATHRASLNELPQILGALIAGEPIADVLPLSPTGQGDDDMPNRGTIDRCFAGVDVPAILASLDREARDGSTFAGQTAATLRSKSPTSLGIALEQMRRGGLLSFEDAMRTEFRIVSRVIEGHDFYEGVRAAIIDKDGAPQWAPSDLEPVAKTDIDRYFESLGPRELQIV